MQRLTQVLDFQSQALILRAERQRLVASNIANADTPGYQARELDFANALRAATGLSSAGLSPAGIPPAGIPPAVSHPAHDLLPLGQDEAPDLLYARHSQDSLDRNTVDLDRERATSVDNSVKYEATLRFINGSIRSMLDAMKAANQG